MMVKFFNTQIIALVLLASIVYILNGNCSGFDKANYFIASCGTVGTVWLMYCNLVEIRRQFVGTNQPIIVVDDVKLFGSELTIDNSMQLTRPHKFTVNLTFSNLGDASAFNVLVRVVYVDTHGLEKISMLNWEPQGFSAIGSGKGKSIHKTFELDVAQQICDEVRYRNEHNPILRVETYYRNLHGQWFRNIQLFELKEVWRKFDNGNNYFGGERKKLSDVQDFSFYVVEHNGKNTGCKEISYRDVELACGFKNGIITDGKEELQ